MNHFLYKFIDSDSYQQYYLTKWLVIKKVIEISRKRIDQNDISSRDKILEVSTKLFAEKGFDGTRVDEIAARAEVNKALIYYYFESKEKILEELFKRNIDDYIIQKSVLTEQLNPEINSNIEKYADNSLEVLREKADIIKIAVIEVLKSNKSDESLFKMMDSSFMNMIPKMKEMGLQVENEADPLISGFFFGFAPIIFSIILGEKWAAYHNIDITEFNAKFTDRLKEFYKQYTAEFLISNKK